MTTHLPQTVGASDLTAAAQLVRRPDPLAAAARLDQLVADYRTQADELGRPDDVDELPQGWVADDELARAIEDTAHLVEPSPDEVAVLAVTKLGRQADVAAALAASLAADPCSCPPSPICSSSCAHCEALPDDVPCPHDTDPPAFDISHVELTPADVMLQIAVGGDVDEPLPLVDDVDERTPAQQIAGYVNAGGHALDDVLRPAVESLGQLAAVADQLQLAVGAGGPLAHPPIPDALPMVPLDEPQVSPASVPGSPSTGSLPTLDWRSRHDPRSLAFGVQRSKPLQLADVRLPAVPVLDQGAEGECVGMAAVGAANVLDELAGDLDGQLLDVDAARRLYRRAQQLDARPGEGYVGTSVLAGMKAGREAGLWTSYQWAFGTRDIAATVLDRKPVVIGIPWLSGMYETGPGGRVDVVGEDTGAGHCLVIVGMRLHGPQGQPGPWFAWLNSWGADYGDGGIGYVHHADLARLLRSHGEAAVPVVTS